MQARGVWEDARSDDLDSTINSNSSQNEIPSQADEALYLLDAAGRGNLDIVKQRVEGGAFVDSSNAQDRTSLMIASAEGHISIVSYLLGKRADLNLVDRKGSYALKDAVLNGHFAVRDLLLQNGARIHEKDRLELGKQLCTHAGEGHIEGVRELLQCHASVNAVMYDQRTALHFAAAEGHDSVVAFLLDNRADPRLQDRWGATALVDATRGKHLRSQALLRVAVGDSSDFVDASSGADPDRPGLTTRLTRDDSSGSAPMELTDGEKMCKAAARGDTKCLNTLVGRGAAVNAMDYDRRSALHLAACEGHLGAVEFLVKNNANVNSEDRWGNRPLRDAAQGKHTKVIAFLEAMGATYGERELSDSNYGDKLCKAAAKGELATIQQLLAKGADVNSHDYDKRSALHLASAEGHAACVEFLVLRGAQVNAQDRWGHTPLKDAKRGSHTAVEGILIKAGATFGYGPQDVSEHEVQGEQLCKAAAKGDLNMIRNLVAKGASVDACDYDRRSALHLAAAEGHEKVVDYLIRHKADVHAKDRFGADALRDAIRGKHAEVQQVLFNAGATALTMQDAESKAKIDDYTAQPLYLRAKAEKWSIDRSEIRIGHLLGEGAQGQVNRADWRGMVVAVKLLKNARISQNELDFQNEISVMSTLRHPNLVLFLGAVLESEPKMLISEFLDGGSLEDFYENQERVKGRPFIPPVKTVHGWALELAMAISFLHACRPVVIHRDIKPGNLLLTAEGHLKISDFGLSKMYEGVNLGAYQMTGVTGTLRYMAPEVMRSEEYTEKVDVYSSAFVMWYMVHGEKPLLTTQDKDFISAADNRISIRPSLGDVTYLPFKTLMEECWEADPPKRLTASEMVLRLKGMTLPKDSKSKGAKPNKTRYKLTKGSNLGKDSSISGKKCSIS